MVRLPAYFKLGVFQRICDAVEDGDYPDILTAIKALQKSAFVSVKDGQTVIAASGNGYNTQFAVPGVYSSQELFAFWAELRIVYTDALATLTAQSISSPTHAQVRDTMGADDTFEAITTTHAEFNLLRAGGVR